MSSTASAPESRQTKPTRSNPLAHAQFRQAQNLRLQNQAQEKRNQTQPTPNSVEDSTARPSTTPTQNPVHEGPVATTSEPLQPAQAAPGNLAKQTQQPPENTMRPSSSVAAVSTNPRLEPCKVIAVASGTLSTGMREFFLPVAIRSSIAKTHVIIELEERAGRGRSV
jgi:hypothetical protein